MTNFSRQKYFLPFSSQVIISQWIFLMRAFDWIRGMCYLETLERINCYKFSFVFKTTKKPLLPLHLSLAILCCLWH